MTFFLKRKEILKRKLYKAWLPELGADMGEGREADILKTSEVRKHLGSGYRFEIPQRL